MKVLLDTNIFIHKKDNFEIPETLNELFDIIPKKDTILIHPSSIEGIKTEINEKILLKLDSYSLLEQAPSPMQDLTFNSIVGAFNTSKDEIDNNILYSVYNGAVNYLLTDDKDIHKKSVQLNIKDRVLSLNEAVEFFKEFYSIKKRNVPPQIKLLPIYKLDVNDPIFDSSRNDYPEFNEWYSKNAIEGMKCWCYQNEGRIGAILIFSNDDYEIIDTNPPLPKKRRFKIHVLKFDHEGYNLDEVLLKKAIDHCIDNSIDELYLNHIIHSNYDHLVNLITEYGFFNIGLNNNGENVFFKDLKPDNRQLMFCNYDDIFKKYYPLYYDGTRVKKLVVPIKPEYHEKLFTDYNKRTSMTLDEYFGDPDIKGDSIKKAYLSHTPVKNIKKGDILLFYRSGDHKEITSLGVLEEFKKDLTSIEEIMNLVGNKTAYSAKDIEEIAKKPTTVMIFNMHFHLSPPISLETLKKYGILKGPPQTITEITNTGYEEIKELGGINGNLTIH
ncbi:hypothetical protein [Methanococcus maripaludis]|uniref:PIN domain-containing protein n=2 Tax=Methanococcus maripaludis TaxID=39152 RepID=A6VJF5_METM7|nr:hypothetical protein [Methanococcus maripaludis]MBA2862886.1 putative nucleic acid-binding protein [Methanococcus maripaludis]